jgi:hypothetical protein
MLLNAPRAQVGWEKKRQLQKLLKKAIAIIIEISNREQRD